MAFSDYGSRSGRFPKAMATLFDTAARREARLIAPYLDAKFYLENNSDVAAAGIDACYHYAKYGWREGRDPSPSFSTNGYLSAHPKVAMDGTNPLLHFITENGAAAPDTDPEAEQRFSAEVALVETELDQVFYAATYPEFAQGGLSAAEHYCRTGWREGHDPAPEFSTSYYLLTNPDIRDSGVNPFWHYLISGREEGRLPAHPGGWRHGVLSRQTSFDEYCEDWKRIDAPPHLMNADALLAELEAARSARGLFVSLGHDDYRATPGGVQLCIEIEERDALAHDVDYLNLHPWQPLPRLADADDDYILNLVMNGRLLGAARVSAVVGALPKLALEEAPARLVIHHLAGHAPERVVDLAEALGAGQILLWLHDYFTLCTSYALQRNNVSPCNVPQPDSNACGICLFGRARREQIARMGALFDALDINVISPSEAALDFWRDRTSLKPASTGVHPHITLSELEGAARTEDDEGPVRVAFIGTPAVHKGWPAFRELQRRLSAEEGYAFWFFGTEPPGIDEITHVDTHVRAVDPQSTLRAVAENKIDVVLHWASWPETFSFSTFEAMGGGAFIVTNKGSGNVAAAVEQYDRGIVLNNTEALYAFAKSGGLKELGMRSRKRRAGSRLEAAFSGMSFDAAIGATAT